MTPLFGLTQPSRKHDDTVKRKWNGYKEGDAIELHGVSGTFVSKVGGLVIIQLADGYLQGVAIKPVKTNTAKRKRRKV